MRKHGASKRRTWRKLHIGIDVHTQEIVCVELTTNAEDDAAVAGRMLKDNIDKLSSFTGDGAYDDFSFREILGSELKQIIPPPKDAVVQKTTKRKPILGKEIRLWSISIEKEEKSGKSKKITTKGA